MLNSQSVTGSTVARLAKVCACAGLVGCASNNVVSSLKTSWGPQATYLYVYFVVTGDKKHQDAIDITVYCPDVQPFAGHTLWPAADDDGPGGNYYFWRAGETHVVGVHLDATYLSGPPNTLKSCTMHIASGADEWHAAVYVKADLDNGQKGFPVLPQTGILGFNNDYQNGQPSYDLKFSY